MIALDNRKIKISSMKMTSWTKLKKTQLFVKKKKLLHKLNVAIPIFPNINTYPLIRIQPMFHIFCGLCFFAILSASLHALRFEVRSFDNLKDFKSQLTHLYQVFLGRRCSRFSFNSWCVHLFIQPSLRQAWLNQHKRFVRSVMSRFF